LTAEEKLINIYEQAQKKLIAIIQVKTHKGSPAVYERTILKQVTSELKKLKRANPELVQQLVLEGWKTGTEELIEDLINQKVSVPDTYSAFSKVSFRAINILIHNTIADLNSAVNLVGRRFEDELRQAGLEAAALKNATGSTVKGMQKDLVKRLMGLDQTRQSNGRLGVKYRNGKVVSIDAYAAMVSRTTTAEAQNKSKFVQGKDLGYDLVRMTEYAPTCEVCAKYQGRVYALTKEAANGKYRLKIDGNIIVLQFPYLYDTAFVDGYETIHPNCRHRLSTFAPQAYTDDELIEYSRKSMLPFEDTRSDRERTAYAKSQSKNREKRLNIREWQKYKALFPDDAPKTFSGFMRGKRANSERYRALNQKYKDTV